MFVDELDKDQDNEQLRRASLSAGIGGHDPRLVAQVLSGEPLPMRVVTWTKT
ncbi:hypothetical protein ACWEN3_25775 [Streptomyces sp. NPDC004561]